MPAPHLYLLQFEVNAAEQVCGVGVFVAVGGFGVFVLVGVFVAVGGTGVFVFVAVGGTGVFVFVGVLVGVLVAFAIQLQ